jgi:hypothetical protein
VAEVTHLRNGVKNVAPYGHESVVSVSKALPMILGLGLLGNKQLSELNIEI